MDTNRPNPLRRISAAGLALGVVSATLVAMPSSAIAAAPPAFGSTWVTSQSGDSVTQLSPSGAAVGSPIKGASTGLSHPEGVAADAAGHVFVANFAADTITEYASGASGNVTPIATISGSQTGLSGPSGLVLSGSTVWVTDATTNALEAFTAGDDGNVLPIETISGSRTTLDNPVGVSTSPFTDTLWVVNDPTGRTPSVVAFDPSQAGNQAPESRIAGSHTGLDDPRAAIDVIGKQVDGRVKVANAGSNSITVYDDDVDSPNAKPLAVLSGSATRLDGPAALGLDAVGRLEVANAGDGALRVFSKGAHGNQAPLRSTTALADPGGVGVLAAAPGVPTAVKTTPADHRLLVSWRAPATTGGGILGYQVVVETTKPHGSFGFSADVNFVTKTMHFTVKHLKNGHDYFVAIAAVNEVNTSRFSTFRHGSPATTPGAPRAVKLTPHTDALTATWKAPKHNGGRTIHHYTVRFATCTIGAKGCHAPSITVKGSRRSLKLKGLSAGTPYHVVIRAKNSRGAGTPSKPVTGTPAA